MSGKIFDDRGFLNEEGEKATTKLKQEINKLLTSASIEDIQIIGSVLHKIVGDMVCDAAQEKRNLISKFTAMSKEEFDSYLKEKYEPLYGKDWLLKAPLTEEESTQTAVFFRQFMDEWQEDLKKRPREQRHGLQLSPRHKPFAAHLSKNYGVPAARWQTRNTPYDAGRGPAFPDKYKK